MSTTTIRLTVISIFVVAFVLTAVSYVHGRWIQPEGELLSGGTYSAVLLSNGQVYFGLVDNLERNRLTLRDVYYFQTDGQTPTGEPSIILVKNGIELYGPEDVMFINRDHVVLMQPIRGDSQVKTAIEEYKASLQ